MCVSECVCPFPHACTSTECDKRGLWEISCVVTHVNVEWAVPTFPRVNTWTPTQPPTLNHRPPRSLSLTHTHAHAHTYIDTHLLCQVSIFLRWLWSNCSEYWRESLWSEGGAGRGKSISQYYLTAAFLRWTCIPGTGCVPLIHSQHHLKIYEHKGQLCEVQSA